MTTGDRLMRLETKMENVEKKLDSIDSKLDNAIMQKAEKDELDKTNIRIDEVNSGLLNFSRQSLFQAIGIIVTLLIALITLGRTL